MKRLFLPLLLILSFAANAQTDQLKLASQAFQKKDWKTADQLYKTYRLTHHDDAASMYYIAAVQIHLGNYKTAATYCDSIFLVTSSPGNLNSARFQLARAYSAMHQNERALSYLNDVADHGGNFLGALNDSLFHDFSGDKKFKDITEKMQVNAYPCQYDPRYQKLNFWVGIWDVYLGKNFDNKVAVDTIIFGPGKCSVNENFTWTGGGKYKGQSMIFFDPGAQKIRMSWVGLNGDIRNFEEIKSAENMVQFMAITSTSQSQLVQRRMTLSYNPAGGTVHQFIENSFDLGKTWETDFDAMFKKTK